MTFLDLYYFQVDDLVCPPKSNKFIHEASYIRFDEDQNRFAPLLYIKMIQMNEDFIEAPFAKEIYFKTVLKKALFEGVLRSTIIYGNRMVHWNRIPHAEETVEVSILNTIEHLKKLFSSYFSNDLLKSYII